MWVRGWTGSILAYGEPDGGKYRIWLGMGFDSRKSYDTCGWRATDGRIVQSAIGRGDPVLWNHLALVFDGDNQLIFLNGRPAGLVPAAAVAELNDSCRLILGPVNNVDQRYDSGQLGPVRVSKTARYTKAFEPVWQLAADTESLLCYDMAESGNQVVDRSKFDRHAAVRANQWIPAKEQYALQLDGMPIHDDELKQLVHCPRLQRITLWGTQITDAGLEHLAHLSNLRFLGLSHRPISDVGIAHLKNLAALEELHLWNTALSDRGMQHLAAMQNLAVLWLGRTFVSSSGLAQLAKLTNLETLVLSETATSDPALVHLRPLKKLKELHLWKTRISDEGLTVVSELENLETLLVGGNSITDSGFAKLGKLKRLKRLDLSESAVSGKGLAEFSDRATLEDLKLVATGVMDADLVQIGQFPNLQVLYLSRTAISDGGLAALEDLTKLRDLFLDNTRVTGTGLQHIHGSANTLRTLQLSRTPFNNDGLVQLVPFRRLQILNLANTAIGDDGLESIARLTELKELQLGGTKVTDTGLRHLAQHRQLEYLGLNRMTGVTDAGVESVLGNVNLKTVWLGGSRVTTAGANKLRQVVPSVTLGGEWVQVPPIDIPAALASADATVRRRVLGEIGRRIQYSEEARQWLMASLHDPDLGVRMSAIDVVANSPTSLPGAPDALRQLLVEAGKETDLEYRLAIVQALSRLDPDGRVPPGTSLPVRPVFVALPALGTTDGAGSAHRSVAFSPDSKWLVTAQHDSPPTGQQVAPKAVVETKIAAWHTADFRKEDGAVKPRAELILGEPSKSGPPHRAAVVPVVLPGNRWILVAVRGSPNTSAPASHLMDVRTDSPKFQPLPAGAVSYSSDGRRLAVNNLGNVSLFDLTAEDPWKAPQSFSVKDADGRLSWSGRWLISGQRIYDLASAPEPAVRDLVDDSANRPANEASDSIVLSADERWILRIHQASNTARLVSITGEGSPVLPGHTLQAPATPVVLFGAPFNGFQQPVPTYWTFSRDSKWLVAHRGSVSKLWDLRGKSAPREVALEPFSSLQFSADGRWIIAIMYNRRCVLLDTTADDLVASQMAVPTEDGQAIELLLARNGKRLLVSTHPDQVVIVDLSRPAPTQDVRRLKIPAGKRYFLSDDGRYLSTVRRTQQPHLSELMVIWDLDREDGGPAAMISGLVGVINTVRMSPDSRWLLTVRHRDSTGVWDLGSGK